MTKNVRIMLALFVIAGLYMFVFGCDDTITVHDNGTITGLDSAIEKMAAPVLDPLDAGVKALRDAETNVIKWSYDTTK